MGDKNLSILFVDDPREWFCKIEVHDYINWRRDFSYTFPDLHMKDQARSYGSSLYTFNAVRKKKLYHFYNLCDIIFKEIRDALSEPVIDLFHDKRVGDGIAVAVKFCDDIHPSEPANFCCIMKEAFKKLFEDDFIHQTLPVLFGQRMEEGKFKWRIPKRFRKWATDRGCRYDYFGFICYLY